MSMVVTPVSEVDVYARSALESGMPYARALAAGMVSSPTTWAVTRGPEAASRLSRCAIGGLEGGSLDAHDIAAWLAERWPGATLILGLPLARASDPVVRADCELLTLGVDEVYAVAEVDSEFRQLEDALRATDPTVGYVAVIVRCDVRGWLEGASGGSLIGLCGILIGAYDGEGFLMLEPDSFAL